MFVCVYTHLYLFKEHYIYIDIFSFWNLGFFYLYIYMPRFYLLPLIQINVYMYIHGKGISKKIERCAYIILIPTTKHISGRC